MTDHNMLSSAHLAPVVIHRRFGVSRDLMYAAWTEPEMIRQWLHPGPEWSSPFAEINVVVDGTYRFGFQHPNEPGIAVVGGRFIAIVPKKKLVYTWTWEPPHEDADAETLVTVEFSDDNGGTLVRLTHEQFPTECMRQIHDEGWVETLGCLELFTAHHRTGTRSDRKTHNESN